MPKPVRSRSSCPRWRRRKPLEVGNGEIVLRGRGFGQWIDARKGHRGGKLCVGDIVSRVIDHAQAYDAQGTPKGNKITTQEEADRLPRSTTIGFYGELELSQPTDEAWVQRAEQAYHEWQESQRQLPDDMDDEFA